MRTALSDIGRKGFQSKLETKETRSLWLHDGKLKC